MFCSFNWWDNVDLKKPISWLLLPDIKIIVALSFFVKLVLGTILNRQSQQRCMTQAIANCQIMLSNSTEDSNWVSGSTNGSFIQIWVWLDSVIISEISLIEKKFSIHSINRIMTIISLRVVTWQSTSIKKSRAWGLPH